MHDEPVLVAVDAALRSPSFCPCGESLTIGQHDGALWLECPARTRPSRLPAPIAAVVRDILHDRRFVIEVPEVAASASPTSRPGSARRPLPTAC